MVLTRFLYWIVFLFFITLIIRLVFDWIQVFSRDWRPRGVALVVAEAVYSATDPPLSRCVRCCLRCGSGPCRSTWPSWSWRCCVRFCSVFCNRGDV